MDFVLALVEAASETYEREFGLRIHLVYLRLWESPLEPWDDDRLTGAPPRAPHRSGRVFRRASLSRASSTS